LGPRIGDAIACP
jgi:hypothetical protein